MVPEFKAKKKGWIEILTSKHLTQAIHEIGYKIWFWGQLGSYWKNAKHQWKNIKTSGARLAKMDITSSCEDSMDELEKRNATKSKRIWLLDSNTRKVDLTSVWWTPWMNLKIRTGKEDTPTIWNERTVPKRHARKTTS